MPWQYELYMHHDMKQRNVNTPFSAQPCDEFTLRSSLEDQLGLILGKLLA